jgi:hypothetical protein
MSLPLAFNTGTATIPAKTPYLSADRIRADEFRKILSPDGTRKICGLSWHSKAEETGARRSVNLMQFFSVIDPADYIFVNLQYGDVSEEIAELKASKGIDVISFSDVDNYHDIDGFAALVDACDVVVSIDNTTVHLAGALHKKTFVMLPHVPDWRWMLDREDSPWYPSLRLFRQDSPSDWYSVFNKVGSALREALDEMN